MQQKDIDEANVICADADWMERIDIHTAHFDILDTALAKRPQRPLSGPDAPLWPDLAVELVFDLQQGGRQLTVVRAIPNADGLVLRIRFGQRAIERNGVALEAVETY